MIKYTVIGGWLGSGKTTLINQVLAGPRSDGQRIAIVVNDVGEINIDAALIRSRDSETIELTNGCVCCSIGGSLAITLRDLSLGGGPGHRAPDWIVVEASGVADPAKVASYGDRRLLRLDAVVVTVDCLDLERRLADEHTGPMVRHQIDAADVLILTKTDLATPEQFLAAHNWCRANVPATPIVEAAEIVRSFDIHRDRPSTLAPPLLLESRTWRPNAPVDLTTLSGQLTDGGIVRAKGVLRGLDGVRYLVQHTDGAGGATEPTSLDVPEGLVLIATADHLDRFLTAGRGRL